MTEALRFAETLQQSRDILRDALPSLVAIVEEVTPSSAAMAPEQPFEPSLRGLVAEVRDLAERVRGLVRAAEEQYRINVPPAQQVAGQRR